MGDSSHLRENLKYVFHLEKNKRLQEVVFHSEFVRTKKPQAIKPLKEKKKIIGSKGY